MRHLGGVLILCCVMAAGCATACPPRKATEGLFGAPATTRLEWLAPVGLLASWLAAFTGGVCAAFWLKRRVAGRFRAWRRGQASAHELTHLQEALDQIEEVIAGLEDDASRHEDGRGV